MVQKRVKVFASVKKNDPSATLKVGGDTFFVYLHKIFNVNYDGFRPNINPYFPYGIRSVSTNGILSDKHLYFTAIMDGRIRDPEERKHYLFSLYLPGLKVPFKSGDTFNFALEKLEFQLFYDGKPVKRKLKTYAGWTEFSPRDSFGEGGLITIPDSLPLVRKIEVSVVEISQEEWKKGPWASRESFAKVSVSLQNDFIKDERKTRRNPPWVPYALRRM